MRIVVTYESIFGNTRLVAEAIAKGFGPNADVGSSALGRDSS